MTAAIIANRELVEHLVESFWNPTFFRQKAPVSNLTSAGIGRELPEPTPLSDIP